jgi:hypothetical protein
MMSLFNRTAFLAALAIPFAAWAQDADDPRMPENFHSCTLSGGAGFSAVAGKDNANLSGEWIVQGSLGFAVVGPSLRRHNTRYWSFFLGVDYLFDQTSVKSSALVEARILNPTDVGLLSATGGTARFNAVAFDPTLRIPLNKHAEFYVFGGFGWFHREVDLTGVSSQGSLLQPGNPAVFLRTAGSGSFDGGGGINFKKKGWPMPYVEIRVVHGMAVNSSTTLVPFAAGIRW